MRECTKRDTMSLQRTAYCVTRYGSNNFMHSKLSYALFFLKLLETW